MYKATLVVPTIRETSIKRFLEEWKNELSLLKVIIVEDNPEKTFLIPNAENIDHYSWQEIDKELGEDSWIIPRRTDCIRSFGYYKAYQADLPIMITLDDDCYPLRSEDQISFVETHINQLQQKTSTDHSWCETTEGVTPRGVPYFELTRERECILNHGLWENVPDYDAPTQLLVSRDNKVHTWKQFVVPVGKYYPMCGMNVAIKKELIPAFYFLLMGRNYPYDRFGDIWAGVISKKIIDHLGYAVSSGKPAIHHDRASNVWANLRKEAPGLEINETLWKRVDQIVLRNDNFKDCYLEISERLDIKGEYWDKLKSAMKIWANLF